MVNYVQLLKCAVKYENDLDLERQRNIVCYFTVGPLAVLFLVLFGCVYLVTVDDFAMKMCPFDTLFITWGEA